MGQPSPFIRVVAGQASTPAIFSLYKALILPILEYGCPAWHPHTLKQEQQLSNMSLKKCSGDNCSALYFVTDMR